ncbi:uncharacterized protein LOC135111834 [Scylla paramamosain]|uniref:uncharacterized protein LOC135111834 n=1 Tax=Scylla paramamosain TaxID=85552 RepID=UPI0030828899
MVNRVFTLQESLRFLMGHEGGDHSPVTARPFPTLLVTSGKHEALYSAVGGGGDGGSDARCKGCKLLQPLLCCEEADVYNIYNNLCALDYQKCSDATLTQLDEAACKKLLREKKCRQTCVQVKPTILCGADGMLYSDCELEAKRCNEPDFQADDNLKACPGHHPEGTSEEVLARNLKMTSVEQTGMSMNGKVLETNDGPVIKPKN